MEVGSSKRPRPETPPETPIFASTPVNTSHGNTSNLGSYKAITVGDYTCSQGVRGNVPYINISDSDVIIDREPRGPTIRFAPSIKEQLNQPWSNALIIKLMGVTHSYKYFSLKLREKWSMLKGHWSLVDITNGYYIVKFASDADRKHVLCEGPWIITGRYLAVQQWKPCFQTQNDTISSLTVWVRVSGLHIEWFNFQVLTRIGALLGITHKIDMRSVTQERGQYARICVEIDLTKPLDAAVKLDDIWYQLQYEGLHLVCFKCGLYGHDQQQCPNGGGGTAMDLQDSSRQVRDPSTSTSVLPPVETTMLTFGQGNIVPPSRGRPSSAAPTSTMPPISPMPELTKNVEAGASLGEWNIVQPRRRRQGLAAPSRKPAHPSQSSGSRFYVLQDGEEPATMHSAPPMQSITVPPLARGNRGRKTTGQKDSTSAAASSSQLTSLSKPRAPPRPRAKRQPRVGAVIPSSDDPFTIPSVFTDSVVPAFPTIATEEAPRVPPKPPDNSEASMEVMAAPVNLEMTASATMPTHDDVSMEEARPSQTGSATTSRHDDVSMVKVRPSQVPDRNPSPKIIQPTIVHSSPSGTVVKFDETMGMNQVFTFNMANLPT